MSRFVDWLHCRQKLQELDDAQSSAAQKAAELAARRTALAAGLENAKSGISELAQHAKSAKSRGTAPAQPRRACSDTHEDAAALLNQTKLIAADQKVLTLLDRRIADQKQLAGIYAQWSALHAPCNRSALAHVLLLNALIVIMVSDRIAVPRRMDPAFAQESEAGSPAGRNPAQHRSGHACESSR